MIHSSSDFPGLFCSVDLVVLWELKLRRRLIVAVKKWRGGERPRCCRGAKTAVCHSFSLLIEFGENSHGNDSIK